jgi:4-hydroxy-3-methylbut-2-enyl diphosphate reductase
MSGLLTETGGYLAMQIILANPRGFCAGVNMAIECLERALDFFGPPIYVYHEIVHNKYVVDRFRRRGTVFVEALAEVPSGAPLLYSAHGVSPQIREEARLRRLVAIDATCPLVIKVHLEAVRYAREGYTIVLIGHDGHDEVIGTMGEAPKQMILVETAEDVDRLVVADPEKVAYLTQTTLSVDDANIVIAALRKKFPNIANPPKDDICYATQNRQEAVRELAARADLVLVLGSQNSSNSRRLAEIANGLGVPARLIDGVSEIEHCWFVDVDTVLITAGASAPEEVVQECIEYLERNFGATIQEETIRKESVHFPLPRSLRQLLPNESSVDGPFDDEATGHAEPSQASV